VIDRDDLPMVLGDHLDELRRRLIWVVILVGAGMIVAFMFQAQLKELVQQPLLAAMAMADEEALEELGLLGKDRLLTTLSLAESPINAMRLSMMAAITIAFPLLIYQLWAFVRPGLRNNERKAGFLLLPAAVLFFYGGVLFGFFIGLPYFYLWLIEWTANDPTARMDLRQSEYYSFFILLTIAFGFVMDIPWLILVLVRARVVTPEQLGRHRRAVVVGCAVLGALLSPPDPISQIALGGMMYLLFEGGVLASRVLYRQSLRRRAEAEADGESDGDEGGVDAGTPVERSTAWDADGDSDEERP